MVRIAAILNRLVSMGLMEKMAFEERLLEERLELALRISREKSIPGRGNCQCKGT